jgi:hypothetical protein
MAFTVVALRAEVVAALAAGDEGTTWSDALVDAALRRALQAIDQFGPTYEATHVVSVAGATQNLAALPGLAEVTGLAWPWHERAIFEACSVRWRSVGEAGVVQLRSALPAVGDALRVRYRKAHTLEGLDDAVTTTLPVYLRATLALGGALYAAQLRARQAIENPALPEATVAHLQAWTADLERAFFVDLVALTRTQANPVWDGAGL